jgi:hypothetical protein
MKKIIKPAEREEAVYYSDFSGKNLGKFAVPVELKISCGYESKYDGMDIIFHLHDEDLEKIITYLKSNISKDFKESITKKIDKYDNDYESSMQMRDWDACDNALNNLWFLRNLIDFDKDIK